MAWRAAARAGRPPRAPSSASSRGRSPSSSTNSSPPWRASRPPSPSAPRSRAATRRSSRSPAPCPSESLTSLKLSRSTSRSATARWRRRARVTAARTPTRAGPGWQPGQRVEERELAQLLLGAHAVGDVLAGEHGDRAALGVGQRRRLQGHAAARALAGQHVRLVALHPGLAAGDQALERLPGRSAVLLRDHALEPVLADQLAEDLAPLAVEQADGAVGVEDHQQRAGHVEVGLRAIALHAEHGLDQRGVDEDQRPAARARDLGDGQLAAGRRAVGAAQRDHRATRAARPRRPPGRVPLRGCGRAPRRHSTP